MIQRNVRCDTTKVTYKNVKIIIIKKKAAIGQIKCNGGSVAKDQKIPPGGPKSRSPFQGPMIPEKMSGY